MNIAVSAALAAWTGRTLSDTELLTLAMNIEAQVIKVPTGVQDYYAARFGGLSAIVLDATGVHRQLIAASPEDLERRLVLAYTGASRNSGINNWDVMVRRVNGDPTVIDAFNAIRDAAAGVRAALEEHDWPAAGGHLDAEWQARKRLAPGVTTREIDALLDRAIAAGAYAGKVCGAGGGGCLMALTPPDRRDAVASALADGGAKVLPVSIAREGLTLHRD
jgi:D-glycero-alpha-D-manno-heptose-7-phosphate kinase